MGSAKSTETQVYEEEEIEENPNHVELGDQNAVRNMMDDAIVEFCQDRETFTVHYSWDNAKLLLMVIATAIAAASHFYRTPLVSERTLIYGCVIGFFVIHGLLLVYSVLIERDVLVRMSIKGKEGDRVMIKTNLPYTESTYTVEVHSVTKPGLIVKQDLYIGKFFDIEGYFDKERFTKQVDEILSRFEKQKTQ